MNRFPFTYHHDYLRMNVSKFQKASRSEIASIHLENFFELHVVALIQLLDELDCSDVINLLDYDDIEICKQAYKVTEDVVSKYE